jgi:disulfide bond formation protein DsbB
LSGSGECAESGWQFLGLSIAGWSLIWFVVLGAYIVWLPWQRAQRRANGGMRSGVGRY